MGGRFKSRGQVIDHRRGVHLDSGRKAKAILKRMRQTAMRRGAISPQQRQLKAHIASTIEAQGIPMALAQRIAFQLVIKFDAAELADPSAWRAIGQVLLQEFAQLKAHAHLADRQIITLLPKLSARQVEDLLEELAMADRRIARTILNAALQAAEPLSAGRRYVAGYHDVAKQLQPINPRFARTFANASFTARAPNAKAMDHLKRFSNLTAQVKDEDGSGRMLAKVAVRSRDPLEAAEDFIGDCNAALAELTSCGHDERVAKNVASLKRTRGHFQTIDPFSTLARYDIERRITDAEREELEQLRAENHALRMERNPPAKSRASLRMFK
jgi:hypothetical protein